MKTYRHMKTGGIYRMIGKALVKDVKTRDWNKAVIYSAFDGEALERQVYVRTQKDFDEKFIEIENHSKQSIPSTKVMCPTCKWETGQRCYQCNGKGFIKGAISDDR